MMSLSSLRTQVKRLSQAWIQPGHVVVVKRHECQTEAELEALARAALGREWRPADLLIFSTVEEACPKRKHAHEDLIIIDARGD
jgi:hypothetical protein